MTDGTLQSSQYAGLNYPGWLLARLPALHRLFIPVNRYCAAPLLRMGLGPLMSSPAAGYLMLLRVRGRRSGIVREVPLGYAIVGDALYCIAGFGPSTAWLKNLQAEPRVEVVVGARAFSGIAEVVSDPAEMRRALRALMVSMAAIASGLTGVDPRKAGDEELVAAFGALPLVRVRQTGLAAGPHDPGGAGWVPMAVLELLALVGLAGLAQRAARRLAGR